MDNLTHSLIGFAAAKAGLEKLSPYATPLCIIAANAPDADVITTLAGPESYLHHHRGLSHSIIGTLVIALALPIVMYAVAAAFARWRRRPNAASLRGLTLVSLITSFSHPLLDWTNNYGVRPLLPWSNRWYYGDLVFIIDPWLWLSLGGACFLLTATNWRKTGVWLAGAIFLSFTLFWLPGRAGFSYPLLARILWVAGITGLICGQFAKRCRSYAVEMSV
ncbi:MAG: metal-dependent hydrolase [Pyrinomonadaceae bacterium]